MNPPLPMDIKLMDLAASALFTLFAAGLMAAGVWWALRHPVFALDGITVTGEVVHNNAVTLRANVAPRLAGNFFTVDLQAARQAFEAAPWVRRAVVRREFPNRLQVQLQEHRPVAYWGAEGDSRLVNSFGEVFEANVGDVEQDELPRLVGPEGQAAEVLAMYQVLKPAFEPLDLALTQLALSPRGSWQAELDTGAVVEMGRGSAEVLVPLVQRFLQTLTQVSAKYGRRASALESADLRHADGYAVRLQGVTTTAVEPAKKTVRTNR